MFLSRPVTRENGMRSDLKAMQDNIDEGQLRIRLYNGADGSPVTNARVTITYSLSAAFFPK